ncbi:MAG: hypothetical protein AAGC74_08965 [Verrucomicrobiota bacterium]
MSEHLGDNQAEEGKTAEAEKEVSPAGWTQSRLRGMVDFGFKNPGWLAMFMLSRVEAVRSVQRLVAQVPDCARFRKLPRVTSEVDLSEVAGSLEERGIFQGLQLSEDVVEGINRFARETPCFANGELDMPMKWNLPHEEADSFGEPVIIGDYLSKIHDCEEIRSIWEDRQLLEIAAHYLKAEPKLNRSRLWWSYARGEQEDEGVNLATFAQDRFHFDIHDWRTLKFFFYLNRVDEGSGAHLFINGSHRGHALAEQFTLRRGAERGRLEQRYGSENVVMVTGDAGFGWVEDPYGFHTGTKVLRGDRLMLEVAFGVSEESPAGVHNPAI